MKRLILTIIVAAWLAGCSQRISSITYGIPNNEIAKISYSSDGVRHETFRYDPPTIEITKKTGSWGIGPCGFACTARRYKLYLASERDIYATEDVKMFEEYDAVKTSMPLKSAKIVSRTDGDSCRAFASLFCSLTAI